MLVFQHAYLACLQFVDRDKAKWLSMTFHDFPLLHVHLTSLFEAAAKELRRNATVRRRSSSTAWEMVAEGRLSIQKRIDSQHLSLLLSTLFVKTWQTIAANRVTWISSSFLGLEINSTNYNKLIMARPSKLRLGWSTTLRSNRGWPWMAERNKLRWSAMICDESRMPFRGLLVASKTMWCSKQFLCHPP